MCNELCAPGNITTPNKLADAGAKFLSSSNFSTGWGESLELGPKIGTRTALTRPIGNICDYSPHRKELLFLTKFCPLRRRDIAPEIHYAFRGLAMSLLTHKERSLRGLIVFAFPLESSCISVANIVFRNSTVARVHYYNGCLERWTVDSCGNSTCLKTPQRGFLEEAEAVPAESNGPQRKTKSHIRHSLYQLRALKTTKLNRQFFIYSLTTLHHKKSLFSG